MIQSQITEQGTCQASMRKKEPMQMRLKCGKWYAAFYFKGKYIGNCLDAAKHEPKKAARELGKLIEKLERGDESRRV